MTDRAPRAGRARLRVAGVCVGAAMTVAYFLLPLDEFGPHRPALSWTVFCVTLVFVALLLLGQVRDVIMGRPRTRPGVVLPLLMCLSVLVFSSGYYALAREPGQFTGLSTRVDALYFTVVTLATVGYGDITPRGQTARVVTVFQIVYSFVFLTAAATTLTRWLRDRLAEHR